ncbi:hypothetical protein E2C01_027246 [Portunus trituberculatus]|uniref:Uncharacterized protein n=1 Tax=Portunus trituberculatus TaxID=210409 RepID=A0A5B7EL55_PORTR|nr:hypothetical protein [Portunus trituberculatus]
MESLKAVAACDKGGEGVLERRTQHLEGSNNLAKISFQQRRRIKRNRFGRRPQSGFVEAKRQGPVSQ